MAGVRPGGFAALLGTALLVGLQSSADASDSDLGNASGWPSRPVRLIASVAAGTSLDTLARMTAKHLSSVLGQSVVVENRSGASGRIASEAVARAPSDGHTLLFSSNTLATMAALHGPRAVDPTTALLPVAMMATQPMLIVASPSFAGSGFADVVRAAKTAPGTLPYSTSGIGSLAHLTALWAQSRAGITMLHIPNSGTQSFRDVMTGDIPIGFTFLASALPLVRSGQLKAIAVTSRTRSSIAPEIASLDESGLSDFESLNWMGVLAPAGTSPAIVARLSAEIARMLGSPEVDAQLRAAGYTPVYGTPDQFADSLRQETLRWAAIVKAADLHTD